MLVLAQYAWHNVHVISKVILVNFLAIGCEFACNIIEIKRLELAAIDLSTARPKWRLDGPALSDHLLYSLVNNAYANRYHRHLVR